MRFRCMKSFPASRRTRLIIIPGGSMPIEWQAFASRRDASFGRKRDHNKNHLHPVGMQPVVALPAFPTAKGASLRDAVNH
jgi:hypothetical protein